MAGATLSHPIQRQIIGLIAILGAGFALMAALYLGASMVIERIDRRMYQYHDHAETLALRLHDSLSAAQIPRGSGMGRSNVAVTDPRLFVAEAIRSYDEILLLEGEIGTLHREFEDPAMPDRAMARLARAIAELRAMRADYGSDRAGFAFALATSRPYLEIVAQQLSRHHAAALMSLQEHRHRVAALFEVIGVVLSLSIAAGIWVLMGRNLRAVDALIEADAHRREALRASEERYRLLFDGAPIALFVHEAGVFRYVNNAAVALFGARSAADLVGRNYLDYVHPDEREAAARRLRDFAEGQHNAEYTARRIVRADGETRVVSTAGMGFREGERTLVQGIGQDITEQLQAERSLRESEAKFAAFFFNSPDAMAISRLDDGVFIETNDAYEKLTAYRRDELIGHSGLSLGIIPYPAQRERLLALLRANSSARDFEFPVRNRHGEIRQCVQSSFALEVNGRPAIASITRDVTDARRATQALRQSEERLRQAIRVANVGIFDQDRRSATIYWSPRLRNTFGWDADEPVTLEKFIATVHPEDRASVSEAMRRALDPAGDGGFDVENRIIRRDGEVRWLATRSQTFFEEDNGARRAVRTVGAVVDVTQRWRLEEELRKLNRELETRIAQRTEQLEESNRELEAFSYSVSHDLRAPLRHVVGYIDLLRSSASATLSDDGRRQMEIITDAAKRMGDLIDDLLSLSRVGRQGMNLDVVDMNAIVQGVLEELQPETRGRDIEWQITALPKLMGDRSLLKLVLTNLISNAIKFTRGRAPARIEVGCMGAENDSAEHVVFVKDNGAGFDMRYYDKLFGVFQRLHSAREFEGTGIGLANCRRIIQRHGGRIWAQGTVGVGATFYFALPRDQQRARE
jgi:PAS domain S-box-containing protein